MTKSDLDISVIIATYNRADILAKTLEHMTSLVRGGLNVEFIIVDNNSKDNTKQVIQSFSERIPVRYLFEPQPGQNSARNRALAEGKLGKIVAFTDDDIEPDKNWLQVIASVSSRRLNYNIFGGRIYPIWPYTPLPIWTQIRSVRELGYASHDYKELECEYEKDHYPSSGNFWVRRTVFEDVKNFDSTIEWQPKKKIMASETLFLKRLVEKGHRIWHCPEAIVGHKITAEQISLFNPVLRAYSWGRGMAYIRPLCRENLYNKNRFLWRCIRYGAIGKLCIKITTALPPLFFKNPQKIMYAMQWLGYNVELLNISGNYKSR
jgi:glycosyltransferase involved in cell wall biosynthesis